MREYTRKLKQWEFKAWEDTEWRPAEVPGDVHMDLRRNGVIPDPFDGTNEAQLQWIGSRNWEYRTVVRLEKEVGQHARLVFEGLDTYADVYVNGQHALSADNMFLEWSADVTGMLRQGDNSITVRFRSPVEVDLPKLRELGYPLPATNDQSELGGLGEQRISVFARKAPYHYGWDWGPRFLNAGIWREARLEVYGGAVIQDVYIRQNAVSAEQARLTAVVELEAAQPWSGKLSVSAGEQSWETDVQLQAGLQTVCLDLEIGWPKLWWSRGLGEAHLYTFKTRLTSENGGVEERETVTGLRDIRLVREKDEHGTSFYFLLNGVPVFAKGANHIPNDSFLTEMTEERYRHELASAAASNINMLRVWGGGVYEDERFYRLCDEYGIMVWQDFMFACSMYPGDERFLDSVRREAEYNVRRLRNHPCIALWCGNNEIDSAWAHYGEDMGWGWKREYGQEVRETLWAAYEALFHRILPEAVAEGHPGIAYWASSPLRDLTGDENQHAVKVSGEGDVHYWGVWHGKEPFENFNVRVGRFMSEYGFQSFPELKTVQTYAAEADMALESEVMLAHQKNGRGNQLIKEYMEEYLPQPKDFPSFLYMSQILQAEAIRIAIESHRRNKPYCMGTLYWQLNDCWPVASWSGIDYYGRWKALQYIVRRSFKDVILSIDDTDGETLKIHAVSDLRAPLEAVLHWAVCDFRGQICNKGTLPVNVGADSSAVLCVLPVRELTGTQPKQGLVFTASLVAGGEVLDDKTHLFIPMRELELETPVITVTPDSEAAGVYLLETDVLAKSVYLTAGQEGIFSDNFFDLLPGQPKRVSFYRRDDGAEPLVQTEAEGLAVRSMKDFI